MTFSVHGKLLWCSVNLYCEIFQHCRHGALFVEKSAGKSLPKLLKNIFIIAKFRQQSCYFVSFAWLPVSALPVLIFHQKLAISACSFCKYPIVRKKKWPKIFFSVVSFLIARYSVLFSQCNSICNISLGTCNVVFSNLQMVI